MGILLLTKTGFSLAIVVAFIAIWAIVSGFVEFIASLEMPPDSGRAWMGVSGVISVILGILLLALPLETVYAVIVILAAFLLVGGVIHIVLAFYARKVGKELLGS